MIETSKYLVSLVCFILVICSNAFGQNNHFKFNNNFFSLSIKQSGSYSLIIELRNRTNDTLQCTPFVKYRKVNPSHGLGCDTIDFATHMISCNKCQQNYDLTVLHGECRLFYSLLARKRKGRFLYYFKLEKNHILIFRVFSRTQKRGTKFIIPLFFEKKGDKINFVNIGKFDE